jgi:hypothetical protein
MMQYLSKPYKNRFFYWLRLTEHIFGSFIILLFIIIVPFKMKEGIVFILFVEVLLLFTFYCFINTIYLYFKSRIIKFDSENIYIEYDNICQSFPLSVVIGIQKAKFSVKFYKLKMKQENSDKPSVIFFHNAMYFPINNHKKIREEVLLLAKKSLKCSKTQSTES